MPLRNTQPTTVAPTVIVPSDWEHFTKKASHYMWTVYCAMSGNYIAVVTVLIVLLLSFLLPDITQKLHASQELKSMKKVLDKMSNDVKQAEVACLTVADEICCLHCAMHDDTTETEVTIMSYVYTDSFDAQKTVNSVSK